MKAVRHAIPKELPAITTYVDIMIPGMIPGMVPYSPLIPKSSNRACVRSAGCDRKCEAGWVLQY